MVEFHFSAPNTQTYKNKALRERSINAQYFSWLVVLLGE